MAMYPSTGYGFPNAQGAGLPQFNNPAAPPQQHHQQQNVHMQQQPGQAAPGAPPGQQQQMMFNPQQFAAMGAQPSSFSQGSPGAGVMAAGPAPAGMMQNPAMPHMAPAGQSKSS